MQVIVAPGRFSTTPAALERDLDRWTGTDGVSGVFSTEDAAKARAANLREQGWTASHGTGPGEGECAILTKNSVRKVIAFHLVELNAPGGKGRLANGNYAPIVIVEGLASGRRTLLTDAHLRAHLEGLWVRIDRDNRTDVKQLLVSAKPEIRDWIEDVQTWRAAVNHYAAKYHVDDQVVAGDWNLDGHDAWVAELMAKLWPGLQMIVTEKPDLGRRAVGWILTTFDDAGTQVLNAHASDHDAGHFTLRHLNTHPGHKPDPRKTPPDPFELCTYNGHRMDQKTKTAVELGEKRLGYSLTVYQGYNPDNFSTSAGTHGRGVVDFAPFDWERKVRVFREMGWFIWHRPAIPGVWVEHIHGGIRNEGQLTVPAKHQQDDFDAKPPRNGLADHAVDTTGVHPSPPAHFDYEAEWRAINT